MSELTFKNKKGKWVTYPNPQEQIEWLESEVKRLKKALNKVENLPISDVSHRRELLIDFWMNLPNTNKNKGVAKYYVDEYLKSTNSNANLNDKT